MAPRVSPSERVRAEMDALFSCDRELAGVLEEVGRVAVCFPMQQTIEAKVDAFSGRSRHQPRNEEHPAGSRNDWQTPAAVKTTTGQIELSRPKPRDTDERFCSAMFSLGLTRATALEALVVSARERGLSGREVEATLKEVLGDEATLSRSTVSRICQRIKDAFAAFAQRDLSYLRPPLLIVSDGPPGLIAAIEPVLPSALRQRCVIHRIRDVVAKISQADQDASKSDWGERAYRATVTCLVEIFESLTVHLRCPKEHWKRRWHTNLTRRTFGETRCRTKVIGQLPGERTSIALVFTVLVRQG